MNKGGGPVSPNQGGLSWSQPPEKPKAAPPSGGRPAWEKKPAPKAPVVASSGGGIAGVSNRSWRMAAFAGGVILGGLLIGWGWSSLNSKTENDAAPTTSATTNGAVSNSSAITVSSPQKAGLTVAVSVLAVSSPTWIVVYESRNGEPGNALGAALFAPESKSGSVNLLRGTIAGQTYFVGQRRDNGDRVFSLLKDLPVVDQNGAPILTQFTTQ